MTQNIPLSVTNNLFETIICQLSGMILLKDCCSKYLFSSPAFLPMIGYRDNDQIVGITDHDIKCNAAQFALQFIDEDHTVMQNREPASFIYVMKYADDNIYYLLGSKKPFLDPQSSAVIGMLAQFTSITDLALIRSMNHLVFADRKFMSHKKELTGTYRMGNIKREDISLTEKQAVCLFYLLRGKTTKEIGQLLFRSPRTIEVHIEQLKNKFDCPSKSLLIAKAIELGYLYHIPSSINLPQIYGQ